MQKRYQVFVSSTYEDLKEERAEVMQALLELDCMPAGMELFPASSDEQWSWIKRVIDESDYYLVIVGGRYGSINKRTNLSFTEMEYRYAVEVGKPVIAFLHQEPEQLPGVKLETSQSKKRQLSEFRSLCETKLCKYWTSLHELGAKVSRSVTQLQKHNPSPGWIRGDSIDELETIAIQRLKEKVQSLEVQISSSQREADAELELADGSSEFGISYNFVFKEKKINKSGSPYWTQSHDEWHTATFTWDEALAVIGHNLLLSPSEGTICRDLIEAGRNKIGIWDDEERRVENVRISSDDAKIVRTQLMARGLLEVKTGQYGVVWNPTAQAKRMIVRLVAKRK